MRQDKAYSEIVGPPDARIEVRVVTHRPQSAEAMEYVQIVVKPVDRTWRRHFEMGSVHQQRVSFSRPYATGTLAKQAARGRAAGKKR
jgi:hypothetical protein